MSRKILYGIFAVYFLALYAIMAFPPILATIDKIEPHILGLPCAQFFILFDAVMFALGLMVFYLIEYRMEDKLYEKEQKKIAEEVAENE